MSAHLYSNASFCAQQYMATRLNRVWSIVRRVAVLSLMLTGFGQQVWAQGGDDLGEFSIEDLMNMEVTSVSKKAQKLSDSPAAVFVITRDDVRRSGATSIPEALRLAPGIDVARIDANKWAIGSRGFNGRFANKLLVMVDGRTVYSPLFSGVYWEAKDVMLEDLERIEVIRGPGATLWGANAVNGVINIITRHAVDTQGVLVAVAAGDEEKGNASIRIGGEFGEGGYGRAYLKGLKRDEFARPSGDAAGDGWDMIQSGFRMDFQPSYKNSYTLQGDFYSGDIDQEIILPELVPPSYLLGIDDSADTEGWNMLGRWRHTQSSSSEFTLQAYYDSNDRDEALMEISDETFDIELQHSIVLGGRHSIVWGLGYRHIDSDISSNVFSVTGSERRTDDLFNFFFQDEITLIEDELRLTFGSKVERNDYTGTEIQPSARLMWTPASGHKLWFSASQAVRTASRAEQDFSVPTLVTPPVPPFVPPVAFVVTANDDYDSEELTAWEVGYRVAPLSTLSLDITAFYNEYKRLRSTGLGVPVFMGTYVEQPLVFDNGLKGETYGFEWAAVWQASKVWRWDLAYSYLETDYDTRRVQDGLQNGISPRHRLSLRSQFDISANVELDFWVRYTDDASAVNGRSPTLVDIDSYVSTDARLAWHPNDNFELALVGQNLFDSQHPEYIQESFTLPTEVERGVYLKLVWQP